MAFAALDLRTANGEGHTQTALSGGALGSMASPPSPLVGGGEPVLRLESVVLPTDTDCFCSVTESSRESTRKEMSIPQLTPRRLQNSRASLVRPAELWCCGTCGVPQARALPFHKRSR